MGFGGLMNNLTVVIPVGPMHTHIYQEAADSVESQTVKCDYSVQMDTHGKGTGWARNQGLARVTTPYVTFLDADDILDPRFAETCLGVLSEYAQSHADTRYAYTDWLGSGNEAIQAPDPCIAWTEKTFHVVTTVIPTQAARLIGGFDETMQGAEDADFYIRLRLSGVCGLHLNAPLMSYREGGQRSVQARLNGHEAHAQLYMSQRYGGYNMGCCGDSTQNPITPDNEPNPGDVLVQAQWGGNMVKRGLATGALYPRTSYPKLLYVNEADAAMSPNLFKRVTSPQSMSNGIVLQPQYKPVQNWQDVVGTIYGGVPSAPVLQPVEVRYNVNTAGRKKADIVAKAQETWEKVEGSGE